jgi:hypothetical protein
MRVIDTIFGARPAPPPLISAPPPDAVWHAVRPRANAPVRARLATRNGALRTTGGLLHYRSGEHYIVTRRGGGASVVKRSIFEATYRRRSDGQCEKRTDIDYRYFVLPHPVIVATPEGRQRAAAGDWIMQGTEGELWPISPAKGILTYAPAETAQDARPLRANTFLHLVETIAALARNHDVGGAREVSVGDIMSVIGRRSYGPLLLLIGLFSISPATVVPGMTWFAATLTLFFALQLAVGARHPWLPRGLLRTCISRQSIRAGSDGLRRWARRIDLLLQPRLTFLSEAPFANLAGLLCAVAALATFPLGLIPLAPIAPGLAIVLVGLGLLARDGLLLLLGGAVIGGAAWLAYASVT